MAHRKNVGALIPRQNFSAMAPQRPAPQRQTAQAAGLRSRTAPQTGSAETDGCFQPGVEVDTYIVPNFTKP